MKVFCTVPGVTLSRIINGEKKIFQFTDDVSVPIEIDDEYAQLLVEKLPHLYSVKADKIIEEEEEYIPSREEIPDVEFPFTEEDLKKMNKDQLIGLAKEIGLSVNQNYKEETIIKKILEAKA